MKLDEIKFKVWDVVNERVQTMIKSYPPRCHVNGYATIDTDTRRYVPNTDNPYGMYWWNYGDRIRHRIATPEEIKNAVQ